MEPFKHHYSDIDERRKMYAEKLGPPPTNGFIYDYYINMMDLAIQSGSSDADANRMRFPHSIRTKQELIKILMIARLDGVASVIPPDPAPAPPVETKKSFRLFKRKKK